MTSKKQKKVTRVRTKKDPAQAAQAVKKLREAGMSCEGIADVIGVGLQSVKRWEAATHCPQPGTLRRLLAFAEKKTK